MFFYFKIIHFAALLFWLGPALGAYWILLKLKNGLDAIQQFQLEKYYEQVLRVEHVAFLVVISSGLGMLWATDWVWLAMPWMKIKLTLVGIIFLMEIFDIYLSHFYFLRLCCGGSNILSSEWSKYFSIKNLFYLISTPILFGLILTIVYLAVVKTT